MTAVAAVMRRPRHLVLAAVVLGLALGPRATGALVPATACAGVLAALARHASAPDGRGAGERGVGGQALFLGALVAGALLLGGWVGAERLRAVDAFPAAAWMGHAVRGPVELTGAPAALPWGGWQAPARLDGRRHGARILLRAPRGSRPPAAGEGAVVQAWGGLRRLRPREAFLRVRGIGAVLQADGVVDRGAVRGGPPGIVDGIRRRAAAVLGHGVPEPEGALLRGMVLGDAGALPAGDADALRTAGLTHLVAASGANVALLVVLILVAAAILGLGLRTRHALALAGVAIYVPLAGGGPSIVRAGVMGAATLVALVAGRPAARWYALLLAAAVTLTLSPRALEDPGWQMSFAAVLAILVGAGPVAGLLQRPRVPRAVADAVAVALVATIATAPVIAWHFGRASPVALPANLATAPMVPAVLWLGFTAALAGQASPGLAAPLTHLAALPAGGILAVARTAAGLPGAGARAPAGLVLLAAATAALALGACVLRGRAGPAAARLPARDAVLGALALAVVVLARAGGAGPVPVPDAFQVAFLDVGQGDATLLRHGARAVLVDAGPPDGGVVGRLRALGVRRLDALILTHAQADHDGGAAAVLAAYPTRLLLDGRDGLRDPDGDRAATVAARRGTVRARPVAGQLVRVGPIGLRILWPPVQAPADHAGADPNARAVVAVAQDGATSVLLTADAESDVTAGLATGPVDVLKVAHHGSADPGLAAELGVLRPRVAGIEVGAHNTYGHPVPATVAALRRVAALVARTDRDGTVLVTAAPGGALTVRRHAG